MGKLSSMVARFLAQLILCVTFTTMVFFALSSHFFSDTYKKSLHNALDDTVKSAEELMRQWEEGSLTPEELHDAANPSLFSAGVFCLFLNGDGQVLAQTDTVPVFERENTWDSMLETLKNESSLSVSPKSKDASYLVLGKRTEKGFVVAGVTMYAYSRAADSFQQRLLISMVIIAVAIVILSTLAAQRISRPARLINRMAARLKAGEQVLLPENLPGRDAKEIAVALNYLSRSVTRAIQELQYEKDGMRLILEGLNEGILAVDENGGILHKNAAADRLLGGEDTPAYRFAMEALEENRAEDRWVRKLTLGDRVLYCAVSRLPGPEGENVSRGAVALIRDVTEEEHLERTRRDYVANISHELRTPLTSIRGLAEGLRDGLVTEENDRERYYSIIVEESTRLSRLVNDLLELSSLQANPASFETEKVDPRELIEEIHGRDQRLFEQAGLSFATALPRDALPAVLSNEDRLTQVLTIFLDNARKYTPSGGHVVLGAENTEEGVRFFVRDDGIGMDEETCRLAFERFHQAERSHSGKGSGLGLSIAREILRKMDVEIRLTSAPGKGSEFSFVIPGAA